jgi:hypothetical protein
VSGVRDRGAFVLSLDFELIWGTLDLFGTSGFRRACEIERSIVVQRLLDLLHEYEVSATWCVLGHLFLNHCDGQHREMVRPTHSWVSGDWFEHDPGGDEHTAPLFFGRSLVERIQACPTRQEIGAHSFSHVIFGDRGCSAEVAESEIKACLDAARVMGVELRSFAFPRNRVGHLDVLHRHGFQVYRGPGPLWYENEEETRISGRVAHLRDVVTAATPPTVLASLDDSGLWNVPGSMIYFPSHGIRALVPVSRRVRRAMRGLEAAAAEKQIFHLWFHPTNLADNTQRMFEGLRSILENAADLRRQKRIDIMGMAELAAECR